MRGPLCCTTKTLETVLLSGLIDSTKNTRLDEVDSRNCPGATMDTSSRWLKRSRSSAICWLAQGDSTKVTAATTAA